MAEWAGTEVHSIGPCQGINSEFVDGELLTEADEKMVLAGILQRDR